MCSPHWDAFAAQQPVSRIWRKDHTLWRPKPDGIVDRLGWLTLPTSMRSCVHDLTRFGKQVQDRGIRHVVLLGMGGSSLGADVVSNVIGGKSGHPDLIVLDSTNPSAVQAVRNAIDAEATLFIVASKSGTTVEVMSLFAYFWEVVREVEPETPGDHFVAITDPKRPLLSLANDRGFLRNFINPADVGGRFSVLSYFGLVPAVCLGVNIGEFLMRSRESARACGVTAPLQDNPGTWLGITLGCLARNGRDKCTLLTSPALESFGLWAEQLIAESTGKNGKGLVPVAGEPLGPPEAYGDDRLFLCLRLADDDNEQLDAFVEAVEAAGQPVLGMELRDRYDVAGEFFRWEFATALAGACMGIQPFNQPNVQESKDISKRVLAEYKENGRLPPLQDEGSLKELLQASRPGDYVAVMCFAGETEELDAAFADLRARILTEYRLPTTLGYGPRFLHSTGQLHKGGANNGLFLQIVAPCEGRMPIPGKGYEMGTLATAQALGDFEALKAHDRRVARRVVEDEAGLPGIVSALLD
jgi:glucose-6-phosphate isomerase/transaldolase/glucose-6-phosphate isomerase